MTAISISHSSTDNAAADNMKTGLESKGHTSLFLDFAPEAGIRSGSDWETLYQRLRQPPYPGLLAFQEADAAVFFGRGEEILKAVETLETLRRQGRDAARFVLLLGPSGSGKSSLARAGVIPRLNKQPAAWLPVPPFRPREDPLEELAVALSTAFKKYGAPRAWDDLRTGLHTAAAQDPADGRALLRLVRDLTLAAQQPDATMLLTLDQTEELFGYSTPEAATRFLRLLRAALETADRRLITLATMRSDFMGEFQNHPVLQDKAGEYAHPFRYQAVPVDPMPLHHFPELIKGPARLAGLQLEESLVEAMVRDTGTRDALPLLAFTLRRLYERYGQKGRLTVRDYDALGRLDVSIQEEANRVLMAAAPSPLDLEALRAAFVPTMVRITAAGDYARRCALVDDLPCRAIPLLRRLVDAHLLVSKENAGHETIEVAHEVLLRAWPLLGDWLTEDQDKLRLLDSIHRSAEEWDKGDRRPDLLIHRDGRLQDAVVLLTTPRFAVPAASIERAYLDACTSVQQTREAAEKAEQERRVRDAEQLAEEQKEVATAPQRTARIFLLGLVVALLLAALTVLLYWKATQAAAANEQKRNAEQSEQTPTIQRLVAEADANLESVPQQTGLPAAETIKATQPKGVIVAAEPATAGGEGQGQPPAAQPAPAADIPANAAVKTKPEQAP